MKKISIYLTYDAGMSYPIIKGFLNKIYDLFYTDLVKFQDIGRYNMISIINGLYNRHDDIDNTAVIIDSNDWEAIKSYITIPIEVFEFNQESNIKDVVKSVVPYKLS